MAERSVPGPLSAVLVTTCAETVAPPAKTNMSRIKAAENNSIRLRAEATPRQARKKPARGCAANFRKGFKSFIFLKCEFGNQNIHCELKR
jgi:hypothetical protein